MSTIAEERTAVLQPGGADTRGAAWSRAGVALVIAAGVFACASQTLRPMIWGASALQVLLHCVCVGLFVVLPGWAVARWLRLGDEDWLHELGMGWMLGTVLLTFAFLVLHRVGAGSAILAWPMIALPLHFARTLRHEKTPPPRRASTLGAGHVAALLALIGLAGLRTQMLHPAEWWCRFQLDTSFHAGNAAALLHGLPIENPRIAGEPLNYHLLSYVPFTVERIAFGLPIEAVFLRVAVNTLPLLVLLQVFNAGRTLARSAWAGVLAAALVMLHVDPSEKLAAVVHPWFSWFNAHSYLEFGVYYSPSTCVGLAAFATLAILLQRWLDGGRRVQLVLAALVTLFASGAKGSVMPVVLAGLGLLVAWLVVRWRRGEPVPALRRAFAALVVLGLAALPASLILATGEHSFARTMFRVLPFATPHDLAAAQRIAEALGEPERSVPHWLAWCIAPLWLPLYLGWGGIVAAVGVWRWRRALTHVEVYLVCCAVAGLAASNVVAAPGASHLFFTYNGEIGMALLAATFVARGVLGSGRTRRIWLACALPAAFGMALDVYFRMCEDARPLPEEPAELRQYRDALEWVRLNTPEDAILVTARREVLGSVLCERSCYYETELFTPGYHATGWDTDSPTWKMPEHRFVYTHRNTSRQALFREPSAAAIAEIRQDVGLERPLYVIFDRVRWRLNEAGLAYGVIDGLELPVLDPETFQPVFENPIARVVRCALPGTERRR